jgi:putative addiction module component (TIGR02574 family)
MKNISLADVLELPVEERIRLVEAIWDSIAEVPESVEVTEEQRAELDRRLEAYRANPSAGSPWTDVKAHILQGR